MNINFKKLPIKNGIKSLLSSFISLLKKIDFINKLKKASLKSIILLIVIVIIVCISLWLLTWLELFSLVFIFVFVFILYSLKKHKEKIYSLKKEKTFNPYNYLKKKYRLLGKNIKKIPCILLLGENNNSGKNIFFQNPNIKLIKVSKSDHNELKWYFSPEFILLDANINLLVEQEDVRSIVEDKINISKHLKNILQYLKRKRHNIPINSILLCLPCDIIGKSNYKELSYYAASLTSILKDIQSCIKVFLPIYLFATKSNAITGYDEFFEKIYQKEPNTILGWNNPEKFTINLDKNKLENDFKELTSEVKNFTLSCISNKNIQNLNNNEINKNAILYVFQHNFEKLVKNFLTVFNIAFEEYKWVHGLPLIRGVYFIPCPNVKTSIDLYSFKILERYTFRTTKQDLREQHFKATKHVLREKVFKELNLVTPFLGKEHINIRNIILAFVLTILFILLSICSYNSYNNLRQQTSPYAQIIQDSSFRNLSKILKFKNGEIIYPNFKIPLIFKPFNFIENINKKTKGVYIALHNEILFSSYLNNIYYNYYYGNWNSNIKNEILNFLEKYFDIGHISIYLDSNSNIKTNSDELNASRIWFAAKIIQGIENNKTNIVSTRTINNVKLGTIRTNIKAPLTFCFYKTEESIEENKPDQTFTLPSDTPILFFLLDGQKHRPLNDNNYYWIEWEKAINIPGTNIWEVKIKFIPRQGKYLFFTLKFNLPKSFNKFAELINKDIKESSTNKTLKQSVKSINKINNKINKK